jgi:hypothetical protein
VRKGNDACISVCDDLGRCAVGGERVLGPKGYAQRGSHSRQAQCGLSSEISHPPNTIFPASSSIIMSAPGKPNSIGTTRFEPQLGHRVAIWFRALGYARLLTD